MISLVSSEKLGILERMNNMFVDSKEKWFTLNAPDVDYKLIKLQVQHLLKRIYILQEFRIFQRRESLLDVIDYLIKANNKD